MPRLRGFSLIEILISTALVALAAMAAVAYVTRAAGHADFAKDRVFARQKALSILAELRGFVDGTEGGVAADLDGFDDGEAMHPSLSIAPDRHEAGAFVPPDHPLSGNTFDSHNGLWNWYRRITVSPYPGEDTRDLRVCTVRIFRVHQGEDLPGTRLAEVSTVVRTVAEAKPSTRVFDVYLLALENVPGWWVSQDAIQPHVEAALSDLQTRNPGLSFRTHWITRLGYGRDEEYAPYTNEARTSTDPTAWAYTYPGRMPESAATSHYYSPTRMAARMNSDGETSASFVGDLAAQEPWTDTNANGRLDPDEPFTDLDGDSRWDAGNPVPYALADRHNHCMRAPDARRRFEERTAALLEDERTPTLRLLLDDMHRNPERYREAIILNLHGEVLPMPPTRNVSDAAKDPEAHPGWRAVAHPELLRPRRVAGDDTNTDAPVFRVHAFKTSFPAGGPQVMTQAEPYQDLDDDGEWTDGEPFVDWNGNGVRDEGTPITLAFSGGPSAALRQGSGNLATDPNATTNPSLVVERLAGGVDTNGDGTADPYTPFANAPRFPEAFQDANGDGIHQRAEPFLDLDGNGLRGTNEPWTELDGDGVHTRTTEGLTDANGNGRHDAARPAEPFTDANGNNRWDAAEPYWDRNGNGRRDGPTLSSPPPWRPWDPSLYGKPVSTDAYIASYGEPFVDVDGDETWDAAESFFDSNRNGVCDGGFARGEMWFEAEFDPMSRRTIVKLHGTPLEAPVVGAKGLDPDWRLYDLEYVPCPTPDTADAGGNRFARDLAVDGDMPKNTARWRITLPPASVRRAFETAPGRRDGDAADLLLTCETRLGDDLGTGVMWPTRNDPQNVSRTFAWFHASTATVPFSARYQMRGDPRHMPYADADRHGETAPHGYNWYFDDFDHGGVDAEDAWLAFDAERMRDGWRYRNATDVPRQLQWLREAILRSGATFTNLTGFSFSFLGSGGEVGYDAAMGYPQGVPVDGTTFGLSGIVHDNTFLDSPGHADLAGTTKLVRSNRGGSYSIRSGGYWWSKPWLGELFDDAAYATQWKVHGNLRAGISADSSAYRQVPRWHITSAQRPRGTVLQASPASMGAEGCTSFFNAGTPTATFHHQIHDGTTGELVGEGFELATNYGVTMPSTVAIARPFHLATSFAGGVGSEWAYDDIYYRHDVTMIRRFHDHPSGSTGSGIMRLEDPITGDAGHVVLCGLDREAGGSVGFAPRFALLAAVHGALTVGHPDLDAPARMLPRVVLKSPTMMTELKHPTTIEVSFGIEWKRWDGIEYTDAYPDDYQGDERDIAYRVLYSRDGGATWVNAKTDEPTEPGRLDWVEGVGVDARSTLRDWKAGEDETWTWAVPAEKFPRGSYLLRVEVFRDDPGLGYAMHEEKIHVDR